MRVHYISTIKHIQYSRYVSCISNNLEHRIDGLNKTYFGKVKFNPDFISCIFPPMGPTEMTQHLALSQFIITKVSSNQISRLFRAVIVLSNFM